MSIEKIACPVLNGSHTNEHSPNSKEVFVQFGKKMKTHGERISYSESNEEPVGIMCPMYNESDGNCTKTSALHSPSKCIYNEWSSLK